MKNFIFNLPTKIIFGIGCIDQLIENIPKNLTDIMAVTDQNLINTDSIKEILVNLKRHFNISVFSEVEENPSYKTINKGARLAKDSQVKMIIGIGGGSSLDTAKGIALTVNNPLGIESYVEGTTISNPALPVVCIPTTSGTGSEVTPFAVFTDQENQVKCGYANDQIFPIFSILDPELTYTMPRQVIVNTGLDVLTHAVEAYLSLLSFDLNDCFALEAIRIVFDHLKSASSKNKEAMIKMAYASMLAGISITHASTILPHIMGYPLTVYHNLPHGLASALILNPFLTYLKENSISPHKIAILENIFSSINNIKRFIQDLGVSTSLKSYGIRQSEFDLFTQKTIVKDDIKITPGDITYQEIIKIYQHSY